jgi:hypothetical protein
MAYIKHRKVELVLAASITVAVLAQTLRGEIRLKILIMT